MKQGSLFGIGECLTNGCLLMTLNYRVGVKWRYRKDGLINTKRVVIEDLGMIFGTIAEC